MSGFPPPPIIPFQYALPPAAFDNLIGWSGISVLWMKSHLCPCVGDTGTSNAPDILLQSGIANCPVCLGRGLYWDPPIGPFTILMTWITFTGRNVNIGQEMNETYGEVHEGHPVITIPETTGILWQSVSEFDAIIESDAVMRFNSILNYGENVSLPSWHDYSLTIAPSGAVVVEDPTTGIPTSGVAYTVSGLSVILSSDYPDNTAYTVEYISCPVYILYEKYGGLPHVRPFQNLNFPRRYKLSILDFWLRNKQGLSTNLR